MLQRQNKKKVGSKECVDTVKEFAAVPTEHEGATSLLFQSLARNISEANLTPQRIRQIEAKVVALVYSELGN